MMTAKRVWGEITQSNRPTHQPGAAARRRARGKRGPKVGADAASVIKAASQAANFIQAQRARAKRTPRIASPLDIRLVRKTGLVGVQCAAMKRDGSRCRGTAMRGARRCWKHGGYEQAPDQPAAARAYLAGRLPLGLLKRWRDHPSAIKCSELEEWIALAGQRPTKRRD